MNVKSSVFHEVNDHALSLPSWSQEYDQISSGKFEGYLEDVQFNSVRVFREYIKQSVQQNFHTPSNMINLMVPNTVFVGKTSNQARKFLSEGVTVLPYDSDFNFVAPPETDYSVISINRDILEPLLTKGEYHQLLSMRRSYGVITDSQQLIVARNKLNALIKEVTCKDKHELQRLAANPLLIKAIKDQLTLILLELFHSQNSHEICSKPLGNQHNYIVQTCHDYVVSVEGADASIVDICSVLNIPHRTLSYSFKKATGVSPVQYLRAVKLNAARRELLSTQLSITTVATMYGFYHMGYFCQEYRRLFDETPSMTRNSAR